MLKIKKNIKIVLISLLVLLVLAEIVFLSLKSPVKKVFYTPKKSMLEYASNIVETCTLSKHKPSCYDEEIPKLMKSPTLLSMEDTFRVTWEVQRIDTSYSYCHVLGHKLSAEEVKKDPSKWKQVLNRCPSGVCSNGCIHGGFQERFRAENLPASEIAKIKPELLDLCEQKEGFNPTGLEQGSCYHALGHLTMYITQADIKQSLILCEEISKKADGRNFSQVCFDGAFMQIFQPLENEDFELIKGKEVSKDLVNSFCSGFRKDQAASCFGESWPLYRAEILDQYKIADFCSKVDSAFRGRCLEGIFYIVTTQFDFNLDKLNNYCSQLPSPLNERCFSGVASRLIETDYRNIPKAVEFCSNSRFEEKSTCFSSLVSYSTFHFHKGSKEAMELCSLLGGFWQKECYEKHKI